MPPPSEPSAAPRPIATTSASTPAAPAPRGRALVALAFVACFAGVVLVDLRLRTAGWFADDWILAGRIAKHGVGESWTGAWMGFRRSPLFHRPLFMSLVAADLSIFGMDALGPHLIGIGIAALGALALAILLRQLGAHPGAAVFAAGFLGVLPMLVPATGWLAARTSPAATLFVLLTLVTWLRWHDAGFFRGRWVPVATAAVAALFRETGYLALVLPLAHDLIVHRPRPRLAALGRRHAFFVVAGTGLLVWRRLALGTWVGGFSAGAIAGSPPEDGLADTVAQLGTGIARLLGLLPPEAVAASVIPSLLAHAALAALAAVALVPALGATVAKRRTSRLLLAALCAAHGIAVLAIPASFPDPARPAATPADLLATLAGGALLAASFWLAGRTAGPVAAATPRAEVRARDDSCGDRVTYRGRAAAIVFLGVAFLGHAVFLSDTDATLGIPMAHRWHLPAAFLLGIVALVIQPLFAARLRWAPAVFLLAALPGTWRVQTLFLRDAALGTEVTDLAVEQLRTMPPDADAVFVTGLSRTHYGMAPVHWGFSDALRPPFQAHAPRVPVYPVHAYMELDAAVSPDWASYPPIEGLLRAGARRPFTIAIDPDIYREVRAATTDWGAAWAPEEAAAAWRRRFSDGGVELLSPASCEFSAMRRPLSLPVVIASSGLRAVEFFCFLEVQDWRATYAVRGDRFEVDLGEVLEDYLLYDEARPVSYILVVGHRRDGRPPLLGPLISCRAAGR